MTMVKHSKSCSSERGSLESMGGFLNNCFSAYFKLKSLFKCHNILSFENNFLNCRVEYVTITPDGFRYRSQIFPTVNGLFRWFKDHYHEPVPGIESLWLCVSAEVIYITACQLSNILLPSHRRHSYQQQSNKDACIAERHPRQYKHRRCVRFFHKYTFFLFCIFECPNLFLPP